jgi:hypothetical protein
MDDRDLEARLRTHLHRRFDNANPSPELTSSVQQILRTVPDSVGFGARRLRSMTPSWSLVGVAAFVAILAVAVVRFGAVITPGDPGSTPSAAPTSGIERSFVVVPPFGATPTGQETGIATEILTKRLKELGFDRVSVAGPEFVLFEPEPTDATVMSVLGATGDVEFVPLPAADYGKGGLAAEIGEPLPRNEPALFGWDGIASVTRDTSDQPGSGRRPGVLVTLTPAAKEALATYTKTHIGETFAIVIDGRVALLPTINEPIAGGEVLLTPGIDDTHFGETRAILVGGELPESWAPPGVAVPVALDVIYASVLRELPSAEVQSIEMDAIRDGDMWIAVWRIVVDGDVVGACESASPSDARDCASAHGLVVTFEASTGVPISRTYLFE